MNRSKSRCIVAFKGEENIENIVGILKVSRYLIEDNQAFIECFKQDFEIEESDYMSVTDTYIHIEFVEVLKELRNKGIGTKLYKFLESNLTELDIVYESYRTISGKNANLLNKIEKCMAVDDFELVYFS